LSRGFARRLNEHAAAGLGVAVFGTIRGTWRSASRCFSRRSPSAARTATVRASVDSELIELTVDAFRRVVLPHPAAGTSPETSEAPQTFLKRIRKVLNIT
jgi:hypothetical protein